MPINSQLSDAMEAVVSSMNYEWVGSQWVQEHGGLVLRVYIDSPDGVTADMCARVSRAMVDLFDEHAALLPARYRLELSSPGVERPLFKLGHYEAQIGKKVNITLREPDICGRRRFRGILRKVEGSTILLDVDDADSVENFDFSHIEKAHLLANF